MKNFENENGEDDNGWQPLIPKDDKEVKAEK
jgi:hypothetical protein